MVICFLKSKKIFWDTRNSTQSQPPCPFGERNNVGESPFELFHLWRKAYSSRENALHQEEEGPDWFELDVALCNQFFKNANSSPLHRTNSTVFDHVVTRLFGIHPDGFPINIGSFVLFLTDLPLLPFLTHTVFISPEGYLWSHPGFFRCIQHYFLKGIKCDCAFSISPSTINSLLLGNISDDWISSNL